MAAGNQELKLYGLIASPFDCRARIGLKLKGVEYKFCEEESSSNKSADLLKYNPVHKKVPVLVHSEKPIAESLVILEYIDETWKGYPILPADPYHRALARFWSKFIDDKCVPALWKAAWSIQDEKEREKAIEESLEVLQFLEKELKDKRFFGGDTFDLVDIAGLFIAYWFPLVQEVVGLELFSSEKFPKLYNWSQELLNHPVVKESLPPKQLLLTFFKGRYESLKASN